MFLAALAVLVLGQQFRISRIRRTARNRE